MTIALWIIAIIEVIRAIQNTLQLMAINKDGGMREMAYKEFIASLEQTDKQFVQQMLKECERNMESDTE